MAERGVSPVLSATQPAESGRREENFLRGFANAYLILFLLDAVLSVVDDQATRLAGASPTRVLRESVAGVTLLASIPMFWSMALWPAIPRSVFLPLTIAMAWLSLGGLPIPIYLGRAPSLPWFSAIQLAFGAAALLRVRTLTGGRWLFDEATLPSREVDASHALRFAIVSVVLGLPTLAAYAALGAALAIGASTGGFVRLGFDGLYAEDRLYRKEELAVRLVGMMHIGESDFYARLFEDLADSDATILIEGATDDQGLLTDEFSYEGIASVLNLDAQEAVVLPSESAGRVVWADIDASEFSPVTLALMNRLGAVLANDTLDGFVRAYLAEMRGDPLTQADLDAVYYDIDERRSEHAFSVLEEELRRGESNTFVMPWGALHMPYFVRGVEDLGFELSETVERRVIAF